MAKATARRQGTDQHSEPSGSTPRPMANSADTPGTETPYSRKPPSLGGPLTEDDYASLAECWITREGADVAMLRRVDDSEGSQVIGQKGRAGCAGIVFPYYWPGDPHVFNYRLRRDKPDWKQGKGGIPKPDKKYLGPPKCANRLYVAPGILLTELEDLSIPLAICEGEKKAIALSRLAHHESAGLRFVPIAIAGVWSWRGKTGRGGGPTGERIDLKGPIPDLDRIPWKDRTVYVVFDTNVHTDDNVKAARRGLARELATKGAKVRIVEMPKDCGVNGVDDLLAKWGPERVLDLFDSAAAGARLEILPTPQFHSRPEGLFRIIYKGERLTQIQLTNFTAEITANVRLDDGLETKREFEIEAELNGRRSQLSIAASEFASMDWPIEKLGSAAITFPNQRDYARTAIQSLSMAAEDRCIYTHTGWRKVEGRWIFLHAGGALSGDGAISDIQVRLPGTVARYELRPPTDPASLLTAVVSSLKLAEIGPPPITFALLAATYRSVFGQADFAVHVAGETGAFKSELAALFQQHFGAGMSRLHLPGSWSSTGNALETVAFHAKDAIFVIDDFAPQGNGADVARYHAAADRVFRAAGNHAGRGRLDSTAKLREPKPPRALILSTGEDIPRGQSVRARLLILELPKGAVTSPALSRCQEDGRNGLYAEAMGGFVRWLASRYEHLRAAFDQRVADHRMKARQDVGHARTPEIVANLQAAFEMYLEFCVTSKSISVGDADALAERCWEALRIAALAQIKHQAATEPTTRFLTVLRSLLSSGGVHIESRNGGEPDEPRSCGWRGTANNWIAQGACVGWLDGDDLFLEPTSAYRAVQQASRDLGDALAVTPQTLNKRLKEKGLLMSIDGNRETLTVRRTIAGTSKPVLHLRRGTLLPEDAGQGSEVQDD